MSLHPFLELVGIMEGLLDHGCGSSGEGAGVGTYCRQFFRLVECTCCQNNCLCADQKSRSAAAL